MARWIKGTLVLMAGLFVAAVFAAWAGSKPNTGDCTPPALLAGATTYRVQAADGNCLQGHAWTPSGAPVRAAAVLVHGLYDHPGRYEPLTRALVARGIAVYAQDHRGHGASGGTRQRVDSIEQLVGDANLALGEAAKRHPGVPLFIYGHSMGGLVAAHVAARDAAQPRLAGVVLSSAALALPPSASGGARAVVGTLSRLAPDLPLEAIDPAQIVREPAARDALARDAAIIRAKVPARTIDTILDGVIALQPAMPGITAPLLILHGGADRVTEPPGSRALAERAGSQQKKLVIHAPALHSLLHEPEGAEVLREVAFVDALASGGRP